MNPPIFCLQVSSNGILSFDEQFSEYASQLFPLYFESRSVPIIAPFWTDINIEDGGSIYYRQTTEADLIRRAQNLTRRGFPQTAQDFTPTHLFIATWDRVAPFSGSPDDKV